MEASIEQPPSLSSANKREMEISIPSASKGRSTNSKHLCDVESSNSSQFNMLLEPRKFENSHTHSLNTEPEVITEPHFRKTNSSASG